MGDKNATESVILGDKFLADFSALVSTINSLATGLVGGGGGNIGGTMTPNIQVLTAASQVQVRAGNVINKIEQYKSKVSKSK